MANFDFNHLQLNNALGINNINDVANPDLQIQDYEAAYQALKDTWDALSTEDKAVLPEGVKRRFESALQELKNKIDMLKAAIQEGKPQATIEELQQATKALEQSVTAMFNGNAQTVGLERCIEIGHFLANVSYDELKRLWDQVKGEDKALLGDDFQKFVNDRLDQLQTKMLELQQAIEEGASPDKINHLQQEVTDLKNQLEAVFKDSATSINLSKRLKFLKEINNNSGDFEAKDYTSLINKLKDPTDVANVQTWANIIEDAKNKHSEIINTNIKKSIEVTQTQAYESTLKNLTSSNTQQVRNLMNQMSDALFKTEIDKDKEQEALSKINDTVKTVYEEGSWRPKTLQEMAEVEAKKRLS